MVPSFTMEKIILSINAGSSSVKISVYVVTGAGDDRGPPRQVAEAQLSGLTAPPVRLRYTRRGRTVFDGAQEVRAEEPRSQDDAFRQLLGTLVGDAELPELARPEAVAVACVSTIRCSFVTPSSPGNSRRAPVFFFPVVPA